MVRVHPDPPTRVSRDFDTRFAQDLLPFRRLWRAGVVARGCSSAGRAPALQAGGHRFDPGQLHQFFRSPCSTLIPRLHIYIYVCRRGLTVAVIITVVLFNN